MSNNNSFSSEEIHRLLRHAFLCFMIIFMKKFYTGNATQMEISDEFRQTNASYLPKLAAIIEKRKMLKHSTYSCDISTYNICYVPRQLLPPIPVPILRIICKIGSNGKL